MVKNIEKQHKNIIKPTKQSWFQVEWLYHLTNCLLGRMAVPTPFLMVQVWAVPGCKGKSHEKQLGPNGLGAVCPKFTFFKPMTDPLHPMSLAWKHASSKFVWEVVSSTQVAPSKNAPHKGM